MMSYLFNSPFLLTVICSKCSFFFLHFHNVRVIFCCVSVTFLSLFICNQQFSFMSSLVRMLLPCMFLGVGCGHVFSMICCFLKCSGSGTSTWHLLYHFMTPRDFDNHVHKGWDCLHTTCGIKGSTLLTLLCSFLPVEFWRVTCWVSQQWYCVAVWLCITDNKANEAHFQRLLSRHWLLFTCWSFLPDYVVCSCFYRCANPGHFVRVGVI